MPESIPWLVSRERYADAEKILRQAAKVNKVVLPDEIFTSTSDTQKMEGGSDDKAEKTGDSNGNYTRHPGERKSSLRDIFKSRKLILYTLIMAFMW